LIPGLPIGLLTLMVALLPTALLGSIPIEQAQREYQARYYFLYGQYVPWPGCACAVPAPAFPPDDFYGDLDSNRTLAVQLVRDLARKFYPDPPTVRLYERFLKTPDGRSGIDGTSYDVNPSPPGSYTINEFSPSVAGADMTHTNTITEVNYHQCLQALLSYIRKCNCVSAACSMTNAAHSAGAGWGTNDNGCAVAKGIAEGVFASSWGGGDQFSGWFFQYTTSTYYTYPPPPPTNYYAYMEALRGKLYNNPLDNGYQGFIKGTMLAYAVCDLRSANGLGVTTPPVGTDRKFHVFETAGVVAGTPYCSAMIGDGLPSIAGGCPADYSASDMGWSMLAPLLVLAPHFKTDPDDIHCSDGGCSAGSCSPNLPGSVTLGASGFNLRISMGLDAYGSPAGYFYIRDDRPGQSLCDPRSLLYSIGGAWPQIGFGTDHGGLISSPSLYCQPQVVPCAGGYTIYFKNSAAPYNTLASVSVVSNSSSAQILVTEVLGASGTPRVLTFRYTPNGASSGTWDVVQGSGVSTQSCVTVTDSAGNQTRTIQVKNSTGAVAAQTVEQYTAFPWGLTLVQRTLGSGSSAQTTSWSYSTDTNNPGAYGHLVALVEPSGRWELNQYDASGRLTNKVAQFGNNASNTAASSNRATQVTYDDPNGIVTTIDKLLGAEVSRTYLVQSLPQNGVQQIQTIRCTVVPAGINDAANLTNILWRAADASTTGKAWDPIQELHEDGTMTFYSYLQNVPASGQRTISVTNGAPNANKNGIEDGTITTTVLGGWNETLSVLVQDAASTLTTSQQSYTYTDDLKRSHTVAYLDSTTEVFNYACCGLDTYVDRDGATTQYLYDAARRQLGSIRLNMNVTTTNVLDAAGNILRTIRVGSSGSAITLRQAAYDWAGQLTSEANALNGVTQYAQTTDGSGQTVKTTTAPDGGTRIETYYQDGSLRSLTGTAVFPVRYEYGVENEGGVQRPYTREIKLNTSGGDTSEWTKTYADTNGRSYKTVYADSASSQSFYNNQGQVWKQVDPDNVITFTTYSAKGEPEYTIVALSATARGITDYPTLLSSLATLKGGTDRITRNVSDVTNPNGYNVQRTRTYVWTTVGQDTSMLQSTHEAAVASVQSWQTQYRDPSTPVTSHSQTTYSGNGTRTVTATSPDGSRTVSTFQYGRLASVTSFDSLNSQLSSINYGYDPHGRQSQITDARNGTTSLAYNDADLVYTLTTPVPGAGQAAQTTTTYYNNMLQATSVVQPDNTNTYTEYYPTGLPKKKYGSRTYPVGYSYDYAGRLATMTNWSTYSAGAGARVTTWNYNAYRGWLDNKRHDDGKGPSYAYWPSGRLHTRTWYRGLTTTYTCDNAGGLSTVAYSDSTPGVTYMYDRLGRAATNTCNGITTTFSYNQAGEQLSESYSGGTLGGLLVGSGYDQYLRRTSLVLNYQQSTLQTLNYGYDNASRLQSVTDNSGSPASSAAYSYLANSPLVDHITFSQSGTTVTTARQWDYLNRLMQISTVNSGQQTLDAHSYGYNNANQRIRRTLPDNSYWVYTYDSLGQVISGKRYWSNGSSVAGQQFEYVFDDIGNRSTARAGGDQNGANLRSASYSANSVNQYTSRTVPGYVSSLGTANASANVTLWADGGSYAQAARQGNYFWTELPVNNSSHAIWVTLTNIAALGSNPDKVAKTVGHQFLTYSPEQFSYDTDGNLTQDGHWIYGWDAENRLVSLTPSTSYAPQVSLRFEYDSQGRRIRKQVWPNTTWNGGATNDLRFVYDGWNLVGILNSSLSLQTSFTWGLDLSGSLQGAGGVGGLLFISNLQSPIGYYAPAYDGNGNVSALISMANGTVAAQYEYGPFGEVLRATGPLAKVNPFTFGTYFYDWETDKSYAKNRYYDPSSGRWLSRDPVTESGFNVIAGNEEAVGMAGSDNNLYEFVANSPINQVDPLGLAFYAIDGTSAKERDRTNPWKLYNWTKEDPKSYYRGSRRGLSGVDMFVIARKVHRQICSDYCAVGGQNFTVNLTGWSRGAVAAVWVAVYLNEVGCDCGCGTKRPIPVNWIGLFDAVNMAWTQPPRHLFPRMSRIFIMRLKRVPISGIFQHSILVEARKNRFTITVIRS
jgi:RHS repeat-associated protein